MPSSRFSSFRLDCSPFRGARAVGLFLLAPLRARARLETRAFAAVAARVLVVCALVAFADAAFAQAMVGQSLLTFAGNYLIAPLGIFAMVVALAGAFFRPDLAKGGVTAAIICAVIFFLIRMAPQLTTALKN